MKRNVVAIVATVSCFFAIPAAAQSASQSEQANEDLRCVIWSALMGGQVAADDTRLQTGLTAGLGYFAGRYEAETGRTVQDDVTDAVVLEVTENLSTYGAVCLTRMAVFGEGLQELARQLGSVADRIEQSEPAGK